MLQRLDEISKDAAVKASAALSKLVQIPVGVDVSPAIPISTSNFPIFLEPDEYMVGMTVPIVGDLQGMMLLFFPKKVALTLCDLLFHKKEGDTTAFTEMESSALVELANIVIGNFLTPFAHPLKLDSVMHRAPKIRIDKFINIIEEMNSTTQHLVPETALIEIVINLNHTKVKGYMIVMLGIDQITQAVNNSTRTKDV